MARRHPLLRVMLMLLPLMASTARLHAHNADTPIALTQELNRCLTMVRIAATRRPAAQGVKTGGAKPTVALARPFIVHLPRAK